MDTAITQALLKEGLTLALRPRHHINQEVSTADHQVNMAAHQASKTMPRRAPGMARIKVIIQLPAKATRVTTLLTPHKTSTTSILLPDSIREAALAMANKPVMAAQGTCLRVSMAKTRRMEVVLVAMISHPTNLTTTKAITADPLRRTSSKTTATTKAYLPATEARRLIITTRHSQVGKRFSQLGLICKHWSERKAFLENGYSFLERARFSFCGQRRPW